MLGFQGLRLVVAGSTEEGGASKIRSFFPSKDEIYEEFRPEKKRRLTTDQVNSALKQNPLLSNT